MLLTINQETLWNELKDASNEEFTDWLEQTLVYLDFDRSIPEFLSLLCLQESLVEELSSQKRHHVFIAMSLWTMNFKRQQLRKATVKDPIKDACYNLCSMHKRFTGEKKHWTYWKPIVTQKTAISEETGSKFHIKRVDPSKGFILDNLYLHPLVD